MPEYANCFCCGGTDLSCCDSVVLPPLLHAHLATAATGFCACLNGQDVPLNETAAKQYDGSLSPVPGCEPFDLVARVLCSGTPGRWSITGKFVNNLDGIECPFSITDLSATSCDPFQLSGTVTIGGACCSPAAVVTFTILET